MLSSSSSHNAQASRDAMCVLEMFRLAFGVPQSETAPIVGHISVCKAARMPAD